ncbi:MAG: G1 family glutamic endopeptidase [Acidimicrobiales bacterium]
MMNPAQREGATMRATAWKILLVVVLVLAAVTIPVAGVAAATPSMIQLSTPRVTGNSVVTNGFAQANTPDATIISNNWNWGDRTSADPSFPVTHPYAVPSDPTAAPVHPSVAAPLLTAAATHPAYPLGHAAHCRTDYHSILREHKVKGHEVRHRECVYRAPASTTSTTTTTIPTASLTISASTIPSAGGSITLTYSSTNASICSLSSSPPLWSGSNPATVSCYGMYDITFASTSVEQQWTFTFTAANASGQSATATQTLVQTPPAPSFEQDQNWSGYVVPSSSALITGVSGEWNVPTLNCADTPNARSVTWVGIGGEAWPTGGSSGVLLQTGIEDDCVDGVQQDTGWFEAYPSIPNQLFSFSGLPVSPGDSIEASVGQASDGSWVTRVDDLTTAISGWMITGEAWGVGADAASTFTDQGSTVGLSYEGGYTCEWIVEDPSNASGSEVPFADYGTVTFSDLMTSFSTWSLTSDEGWEIVQNGVVLSTPSLPSTNGFSVSYTGP